MAPYSPISPPQRPASPDSLGGAVDGPILKKRRTNSYVPQTPPAEPVYGEMDDVDGNTEPEAIPSQNEEMDVTLKRSIGLALNHVGFESASKAALESFAQLTTSYISELLSGVMDSTTTCRRTIPIPQDYEHGFLRMKIAPSMLIPHTQLPSGLPTPRLQYLPQDPVEAPNVDHISLLNPELGGADLKKSLKFIPKRFPTFPALHTYRHTEYYAFVRETDPSKIREMAAVDRRHVEGNLHRRVDQRTHTGGRLKDSSDLRSDRAKKTDGLWVNAMSESLPGEKSSSELRVTVVNSARKYGYLRKPVPITKRPSDTRKEAGSVVLKI